LDVSTGIAGVVYRLNWLFPGAVLVWSGDRLLKFLLDGIPEMQRTVAGKLERVRETEDGEFVVTARNPVVAVWNTVVAPWPSTVAAGLITAPVYYGRLGVERGLRHGVRRGRGGVGVEEVEGGQAGRGSLRGWLRTAPAAAMSLMLAAAQVIRLLTLGGSL
jgi:hypothetical protein